MRASKCTGVVEEGAGLCSACEKVQGLLQKKLASEQRGGPLRHKTPLHTVAKARLVSALRMAAEKSAIMKRLRGESVAVNDALHTSRERVMNNNQIDDPFMRMFWQQQSNAFTTQTGGMRWHPMMVRFAILIHSQSQAAYRTLRETGALKLPGESTLRDYTYAIHPMSGFNPDVIEGLTNAASNITPPNRWVVLLHDEMNDEGRSCL